MAAKKKGLAGPFAKRMASLGKSGQFGQNLERDFHVLAKSDLGARYELYNVETMLRCPLRTTKSALVPILLPHEVAHNLWRFNRPKFHELFSIDKLDGFWRRTIERDEEW